MPTTTNVKQVKLNIMNQADYNTATKSSTELYMIPDAKIGYSDLSSGVQGSLDKADSAIQGVKINGTELTPDSNNKVNVLTSDILPSQTSQNGKYLTTNGTTASWGTVDALPSQTGQSGKFLTTNGTAASWDVVNAGIFYWGE